METPPLSIRLPPHLTLFTHIMSRILSVVPEKCGEIFPFLVLVIGTAVTSRCWMLNAYEDNATIFSSLHSNIVQPVGI